MIYTFIMKTLSISSFRNYWVIVFRFIWAILLFTLIQVLLFNYVISEDGGLGLDEGPSTAVKIIIGALLVLAVIDLCKLLIALFGRVFIYRDTLRDKEIKVTSSTDSDGRSSDSYSYYLYFEGLFGKYRKRIEASAHCYGEAHVGKEYYVGVVNRKQSNRIYLADRYELSPVAKRALVQDIRDLGKCAHWRWEAPEEKPVVNDGGIKQITAKQIVEDMDSYDKPIGKKKRSFVSEVATSWVSIALIILVLGWIVFREISTPLRLVKGITSAFCATLLIVVPIYLFTTRDERNRKKAILAGHYRVTLEKVVATENYEGVNFKFRHVHELMPVSLAGGDAVNLSRSKFNNVQVGDMLYVVYLEHDGTYRGRSIVAVYQEKLGKLDFGFDVEWIDGPKIDSAGA